MTRSIFMRDTPRGIGAVSITLARQARAVLEAFTHGLSGLAFSYTAVQAPMVAGLVHGRAQFKKYIQSPVVAVPLVAVSAFGTVAAGWLTHGLAGGEVFNLAFGTALSGWLGYLGGRGFAEDAAASPAVQRGTVVVDESPRRPELAPARSRARENEAERQTGSELTLAGVRIPAVDETKHFKMIGTTGTGKSTAIRELLGAALERGDRAVVADPDGGYMERFYDPRRGDIVLNPFYENSVKWDLFGEIDSPYDVEQLARSLIPDHDGQDKSWRAYARTFFTAVTRGAHEAGEKDLAELYHLLVTAETDKLRPLVKGTPAQPFLQKDNGRMFDSIRSVTSSAVGALDYVAQQKSQLVSVRDWVRGGAESDAPKGVLFIPYKAGQIAALRSTISAWIRLAIFETMNQNEGDHKLWFVVDELDALGQIDGLKDALARLRKFGGRCVLGFQSIAQVSSTYGEGDAHTIVENCGNSLILRCSASEGGGTARFASGLIGEREVLRTSESHSRKTLDFFGTTTRNERMSIEAALLPSQIEQLPDLSGYLKRASRPEWLHVTLPLSQRELTAAADAKAAWHDNSARAASVRAAGWQAHETSAATGRTSPKTVRSSGHALD